MKANTTPDELQTRIVLSAASAIFCFSNARAYTWLAKLVLSRISNFVSRISYREIRISHEPDEREQIMDFLISIQRWQRPEIRKEW